LLGPLKLEEGACREGEACWEGKLAERKQGMIVGDVQLLLDAFIVGIVVTIFTVRLLGVRAYLKSSLSRLINIPVYFQLREQYEGFWSTLYSVHEQKLSYQQ
jgi:hypothetical protein